MYFIVKYIYMIRRFGRQFFLFLCTEIKLNSSLRFHVPVKHFYAHNVVEKYVQVWIHVLAALKGLEFCFMKHSVVDFPFVC